MYLKTAVLIVLVSIHFSSFAKSSIKKQGVLSGGVEYAMPNWFTDSFLDISEDVDDAKTSDKNVMLFFHLNQCPYCASMLDENFRSGDNREFIKNNFNVIDVNIKGDREISLTEEATVTEKQLSQSLKVQYTPTIIFISQDNKVVYRTNGYRSPKEFKHVLNFVKDKAYKNMTLSRYIEIKNKSIQAAYQFRSHKNFKTVTDFSQLSKPVALLFEDKDCIDCSFLHNRVLSNTDVLNEMNDYVFVRLNAYSQQKLIDFNGAITTPKKWVNKLKLNYRPGIVLFNHKKEITRIDGKLFSFHFKEVLRYVSHEMNNHYDSFNAYLSVREQELLDQGIDIDISL